MIIKVAVNVNASRIDSLIELWREGYNQRNPNGVFGYQPAAPETIAAKY